jgi:hypothetical protein
LSVKSLILSSLAPTPTKNFSVSTNPFFLNLCCSNALSFCISDDLSYTDDLRKKFDLASALKKTLGADIKNYEKYTSGLSKKSKFNLDYRLNFFSCCL